MQAQPLKMQNVMDSGDYTNDGRGYLTIDFSVPSLVHPIIQISECVKTIRHHCSVSGYLNIDFGAGVGSSSTNLMSFF